MFVAFSDGIVVHPYLGFHSLRSLHPRLYKLVAFGDMNPEHERLQDEN